MRHVPLCCDDYSKKIFELKKKLETSNEIKDNIKGLKLYSPKCVNCFMNAVLA